MRTLIVFSHLRWNFVFQRPQQVLTRLAPHFNVLFVEEPMRGNATPFLERSSPAQNVEVLRPRTTVDAPGFDDAQFSEISDLLLEYLDDFGIDDPGLVLHADGRAATDLASPPGRHLRLHG